MSEQDSMFSRVEVKVRTMRRFGLWPLLLLSVLYSAQTGCMSAEESKARELDGQASRLYRDGNYQEAIPIAQQVLNLYREIKGENSHDYAVSLRFLALNYQQVGRFDEAEKLYVEALERDRKRLGELNGSHVLNLSLVGEIHFLQEDYGKAESYLREAAERQEDLGRGRPYADCLNDLAKLYVAMSRYEEALPILVEACNNLKEIQDEHPEEYATSLRNLAFVYQTVGDAEKADQLLDEARRIAP